MPDVPASGSTRTHLQTIGLEPNVAAVLSYLVFLPPITPILVLLLEKENRFVRFHAWQSLLLGLLSLLTVFTLEMFASATSQFSHFLEIIFNVLLLAVSSGSFGLWILLLLRSYQGVTVKLPIIGNEAARRVWRE